MKKIVFFCIPAHGHTNPTLGVVRELINRGHQVWYYSYEPMRQKIEATGAHFIPCDQFDAQLRLTEKDGARLGTDLAFSTKILVDTTLALDETVCRDMAQLQPDCIVADSMALWGRLAARKLGIPFLSSTTTFAFNRYSAQLMKRSGKELLGMLMAMPKISREVRRLRRRGYPVKSVLDIIGNDNDTHTVVYTSPLFQPCSETFSERYAFVGPSLRPAAEDFKKEREKLIYISMGTVNNDMLPLYRSCVAAFADAPWQVVLSVGDQVDPAMLEPLPAHISVFPRVDQMAVLAQCDVFLTHCGMNSVSEALSFGVPLLMLPGTPEQGAVAARTEQLGAGLRLDDTGAESIRAGAERLLSESAFRENAGRIAADFKTCSGSVGAADKILSLCR